MDDFGSAGSSAYDSDILGRLVVVADEVMDVTAVRRMPSTPESLAAAYPFRAALEIRGRLRVSADRAYDTVSWQFRQLGYIALFRRSADGDLVLAAPGSLSLPAERRWIPAVLFLATLLSMLWTGALGEQVPGEGFNLLAGWPFAVSLLGILAAHEMGHYVVARRVGIPASLPYFIPLPLSILGTMGAVMRLQAPPRNRRALLALGAAGPLAGLVVAIPVLIIGLMMSRVQPVPVGEGFFQEGNSLLYLGIKYLLFGRILPSGGEDVFLHPVALAGWAGLFVTALNLIPAGQLDGGHVLYALIGAQAKKVTWAIIVVLLGLSFLWPGWILWVGLTYIFGRVHAVPFDDITSPTRAEKLLAVLLLLVGALVFVPIPMVVG